jgi:LDH2 family malate/lactate/ureidoglycolate dehydrogenase
MQMTEPAPATIPLAELDALVCRAAAALGFRPEDAAKVAEILCDADLHGVHSHGIRLLVAHLAQFRAGAIRPDAVPQLALDRGVTGVVDGGHGYGMVVCDFAVNRAMERAARFGMAALSVRNSSHWGCPSYYARKAATAGYVLFGASNADLSMPLWGGAEQGVGNNPVIFGVPRRDGEPWVLDISMQRAAWSKLAVYQDAGKSLPGEWGLDSDHRPSSDPASIIASGLIHPMGEHKGSGLAVIMEALTGGLAGSLHSHEISARAALNEPRHKSQFFLVMDPEAFAGRAPLERLVSSFSAAAAATRPADPETPVRLPGEGAAAIRQRHLREGIPLIPTIVKAIKALEGVLG